jgi:hypothetical protein
VIVLNSFRSKRAKVRVEWFTWPVAERRLPRRHGIAVTLGAYVHLTIARQMAGMDHRMCHAMVWIFPMKCDVIATGSMTLFARDAGYERLAPVLILAAAHMSNPRIVTLNASNRRGPQQIALIVRIEGLFAPLVRRMEPGKRQLKEPVVFPRKKHFIRLAAGAVNEIDLRSVLLRAIARIADNGLKEGIARLRHLEAQTGMA